MAWIETRGTRTKTYRVCWREGGTVERESFDDADDAERYRRHVERAGGTRPTPTTPPVDDGRPAAPTSGRACTFAEWARYWLTGLSGIKDRTAADYARRVDHDLIPVFGDLDIAAIDRTMVGHWVAGLAEEGLMPKTIRNKHGLLHQVFEAALQHEPTPMRSRNPARGTRLPPVWKSPIRPLTGTAFHRLLAVVDPAYRPLLNMLVLTGLRWGEATGLHARDLHIFDGGPNGPHLNVEWSLQRNRANQYVIGRPKSRAAQRSVPLPPLALELLLPLLVDKGPNDLVFTTLRGEQIRHQNFYTRVWRPALEAAGLGAADGLPALRIHDLRHTYVSWMLHDGPSSTTLYKVSKWLGHESYAFTADRYGHLLPLEPQAEMAALERAMRIPSDDLLVVPGDALRRQMSAGAAQ